MYTENNGELPSIAMPESAPESRAAEVLAPAAPEVRNNPQPSMTSPQAAPALLTTPMPQIMPATDPAPSAVTAAPVTADDLDLIEKEWVDKAKEIIALTRSEPYEQKQEISRLKADYMQKRYNKVVKADGS